MKTLALQYDNTQLILFWTLLFTIVSCFFVYVFLVNSAIVHIVDRKVTQAEYRDVAANISELESQYFQLQSVITPEYAINLGFKESSGTIFAVRGSYSGLAQLDR